MLTVLGCDNRLGKRRLKQPAFLNPGGLERGNNALTQLFQTNLPICQCCDLLIMGYHNQRLMSEIL